MVPRPTRHISSPLVTLALLALGASSVLIACSEEEEPAIDAVPQQPAVDARYATPETLLSQFNDMLKREPIDLAGMYSLIYCENPRQEELLEVCRMAAPLHPLEAAMQQRFKQSMDTAFPKAFAFGPGQPATVANSAGERASAAYREIAGASRALELVKVGQRWWISGLTLERHPTLKGVNADDVIALRVTSREMARLAPDFATRIGGGEFKSVLDARAAIQKALIEKLAADPGAVMQLIELGARNSKYARLADAASAAGYDRSMKRQ